MKRLAVVAVLLSLSACTPEQIAAVVNDYAARMSGTTGTVTAEPSCDPVAPIPNYPIGSLHVVLTGFPAGSTAIVGIAGDPPYGLNAELDETWPAPLDPDGMFGYSVQVWDASGQTLAHLYEVAPPC